MKGSKLTSQDMPFQMFVSGKRLPTVGTKHHFDNRSSVSTVWPKVGTEVVEAALKTATDNVGVKPMEGLLQH
jgi:hypothetical protein